MRAQPAKAQIERRVIYLPFANGYTDEKKCRN
jgi:hypothetical protein